jgi:hypothetical protein
VNLRYILLMAIVVASMITSAQEIEKGLQLGLKGGYDYPFFDNNTPYVDYTGGLSVEGSIDYFWSKWGTSIIWTNRFFSFIK